MISHRSKDTSPKNGYAVGTWLALRPPGCARRVSGGAGGEGAVSGLVVEPLTRRNHPAQQVRRGKARPMLRSQRIADLDRMGGTDDFEPAERSARPGRKTP